MLTIVLHGERLLRCRKRVGSQIGTVGKGKRIIIPGHPERWMNISSIGVNGKRLHEFIDIDCDLGVHLFGYIATGLQEAHGH